MLTQEPIRGSVQPERPALLNDVGVWVFHDRGSSSDNTYIVGSVTADRYLTVPGSKLPAVRAFMQRLHGQQTLEEIRQSLIREHGLELDVQALHRKFQRAGLLTGREGQAGGNDIQEMSTTFLQVPISGLLRWLSRFSLLGEPLLWMGSALIAVAGILVVVNPSLFRVAALDDLGITALIGILSVLLHEVSHCFAAACWGIVRGTVRIQLYLGVIPIVGLKLSGLYTLPARGRLAVWSAGIFANLSIVAATLLALRTAFPGSKELELAATINWLLVMFNLVPLLATDGYFILSTLVKDSNVRVRSWNWMRHPFRPGKQRPSWFVLAYIVATTCLLISTLRHLVLRIVDPGARYPMLQSMLSALLLVLFVWTLWRMFRRKEDAE